MTSTFIDGIFDFKFKDYNVEDFDMEDNCEVIIGANPTLKWFDLVFISILRGRSSSRRWLILRGRPYSRPLSKYREQKGGD